LINDALGARSSSFVEAKTSWTIAMARADAGKKAAALIRSGLFEGPLTFISIRLVGD
jgi:hypothetical protein